MFCQIYAKGGEGYPAQTMTTQSQLDAILHGAAFAPITDRAFLRITGPDATRWLNGMVTNNIKDLSPGEGNYNFLLNAQGRIQGDCTIYREPGDGDPTFLLETDTAQLETIHQLLDKFIIMDDVELRSELIIGGNPWEGAGLLICGTEAPQILKKFFSDKYENPLSAALAVGSLSEARANGTSALILLSPRSTVTRYEVWFEGEKELSLEQDILAQSGVIPLSPEALELYRILSATPRYGTDIRNTETAKDLPQETAQTHALNFNKGCYLGQEIVERIHSRGAVHRTFAQFTLSGPVPTLPAVLELNGKTVGELTSAAVIPMPEGDTALALGYARLEALNQPLTYPGGTATHRTRK